MDCPRCQQRYPEGVELCAADGARLVPEPTGDAPTGLAPPEVIGLALAAPPEPEADAADELAPGQVVGDYRIEAKLGQGGMGVVYLAVHPLIGSKVAVKLLNRAHASSADAVARFMQEARSVNQIGHRNIVNIFTFGQLGDGRRYFVMEYLDGVSLAGYLARRGPLSVAEALPILRDVGSALDAAHAQGIVHRDLKPDNIFLVRDTPGGEPRFVKLLDFGIAKLSSRKGATPGVKTQTGMVMGTPYYMSPEQLIGKGVDHRADVYSLGVVIYQMLTAQLPYRADSFTEILAMQLTERPPPPSLSSSQVPPAVDAPLLRALSRDPLARFDRASELVAAIEEAWSRGAATGEGAGRAASSRPTGEGASRSGGDDGAAATSAPTAAAEVAAAPPATHAPTGGPVAVDVSRAAPGRRLPRLLGAAAALAAAAVVGAIATSGRRSDEAAPIAAHPGPPPAAAALPATTAPTAFAGAPPVAAPATTAGALARPEADPPSSAGAPDAGPAPATRVALEPSRRAPRPPRTPPRAAATRPATPETPMTPTPAAPGAPPQPRKPRVVRELPVDF